MARAALATGQANVGRLSPSEGLCFGGAMLRSCGLNVRLVQNGEASTLKETKGVFMIIKTTEYLNKMKQFKSFRLHKGKGDFTRVETKSSLGLNFW